MDFTKKTKKRLDVSYAKFIVDFDSDIVFHQKDISILYYGKNKKNKKNKKSEVNFRPLLSLSKPCATFRPFPTPLLGRLKPSTDIVDGSWQRRCMPLSMVLYRASKEPILEFNEGKKGIERVMELAGLVIGRLQSCKNEKMLKRRNITVWRKSSEMFKMRRKTLRL